MNSYVDLLALSLLTSTFSLILADLSSTLEPLLKGRGLLRDIRTFFCGRASFSEGFHDSAWSSAVPVGTQAMKTCQLPSLPLPILSSFLKPGGRDSESFRPPLLDGLFNGALSSLSTQQRLEACEGWED